jgi:hypothetical protein
VLDEIGRGSVGVTGAFAEFERSEGRLRRPPRARVNEPRTAAMEGGVGRRFRRALGLPPFGRATASRWGTFTPNSRMRRRRYRPSGEFAGGDFPGRGARGLVVPTRRLAADVSSRRGLGRSGRC